MISAPNWTEKHKIKKPSEVIVIPGGFHSGNFWICLVMGFLHRDVMVFGLLADKKSPDTLFWL
jgi:hypothetical protein